MAVNLSHFYLHVVADVIGNVRPEFFNDGVDEAVLQELQSLWELNMMQAGTIQAGHGESQFGTTGHPPVTSVHDLNMPYEGETPTAEMLFPPTPARTPLPSQAPTPQFMSMSSAPSPAPQEFLDPVDVSIGRPSPYTTNPNWMNQKLEIGFSMTPTLDMNVAYDAADDEAAPNGQYPVTQEFLPTSIGKRKREEIQPNFQQGNYFSQHDGSADSFTVPQLNSEESSRKIQMEAWTAAKTEFERKLSQCRQSQERTSQDSSKISSIPQFDGMGDHYDDGVAEEDYNDPGYEEQLPVDEVDLKQAKSEQAESEDSEPPLNEDDDLDDLDDIVDGDDESKTDNLVLAQFEKVTRSKSKWKCILRDGIMHLQNRDFVFSRGTGEFEF